jgi:hypothetical protein
VNQDRNVSWPNGPLPTASIFAVVGFENLQARFEFTADRLATASKQ